MAKKFELKTEATPKVESVVKTEISEELLNLKHLAKLPDTFYMYSPYTSNLEVCELEKETFKTLVKKNGKIGFVLAVYQPHEALLDSNKEKADVPFNKPQLLNIPLHSFKSTLQNMIRGFFQYSDPIIDPESGIILGDRKRDFYQIRSFYELFAFAYCVKYEDILEPIRQKATAADSNASIERYAKNVITSIKSITIGLCKIPIDWILHIPFHLELNNGGANLPITVEHLEKTYQTIIKR
jgi:hypothetical protein